MVTGIAASYSHSQNGMTLPDMQAACTVASRLDEVIIFRSTGPWAKRWLERNYPSKNFHVKGKSSDWGPQAGLVPYDGTLSKVGYDPIKAEKGTKENEKGLHSGFAIKQHLALSLDILQDQVRRQEGDPPRTAIQTIKELQNGDFILIASRSGDQKQVAFRAMKAAGGLFEMYVYPEKAGLNLTKLTYEEAKQKVEVMRKLADGLANDPTGAAALGAYEEFVNISFEPKEHPAEAKEILDIYNKRIRGKFRGEAAAQLQLEMNRYQAVAGAK